jgi:hypothetical protein
MEPPEFILVEPPPDDVRRFHAQPGARRLLAAVAWELNFPDVETSSGTKLQAAVSERFQDWESHDPDLSERLPPLPQSEEEWAARVALWEYAFRQPCEFQGTDAFVVRSDSGVPRPNVAALLAPALESTLASQLGDLLNPDGVKPAGGPSRWRTSAIAGAEKADVAACRVTRVDIDPAAAQGRVTVDFLVSLLGGWETIWSTESGTDVASVREESIDQIRSDPQVKAVADALEGIGGGQIDRALRFGAAVQGAQKEAEGRFLTFRDRYTRRLTGPPLRWEKPENRQPVP